MAAPTSGRLTRPIAGSSSSPVDRPRSPCSTDRPGRRSSTPPWRGRGTRRLVWCCSIVPPKSAGAGSPDRVGSLSSRARAWMRGQSTFAVRPMRWDCRFSTPLPSLSKRPRACSKRRSSDCEGTRLIPDPRPIQSVRYHEHFLQNSIAVQRCRRIRPSAGGAVYRVAVGAFHPPRGGEYRSGIGPGDVEPDHPEHHHRRRGAVRSGLRLPSDTRGPDVRAADRPRGRLAVHDLRGRARRGRACRRRNREVAHDEGRPRRGAQGLDGVLQPGLRPDRCGARRRDTALRAEADEDVRPRAECGAQWRALWQHRDLHAHEGNGATVEQTPPLKGPNVAFPPPSLFAAGLGVAYLMHRRWPLPLVPEHVARWVELAGWGDVVVRLALMGWGIATFRREQTAVYPNQRARLLVESGPYRRTRNPMYLGMTVLYLGVTALMNSWWPLLLLPLVLWALVILVIGREERYLAQEFGEHYDAYRSRVRRWI